jgi:tetratricopeptide (TPR) repeat protein
MVDHAFICYSRKDEDFVLELAKNLKRQGVPIWLDQWDIPSGANWGRTIEKALKESSHLLLILSPSSVDSDDVQSEWLSALEKGKVVVPILYQQCDIPFRLKPIQYIDFTSRSPDNEEAIQQILNDLEKALSTPYKTCGTARTKEVAQYIRDQNISIPPRLADSQTKGKEPIARTNKKVALIIVFIVSLSLFTYVIYLEYSKRQEASAWNSEGASLVDQEKYKEAIKAYDEAIRIDPNYAEAWFNKGVAYDRQSNSSDAIGAYNKATDINPQYAEAWYNKGNDFVDLGKDNEAIKAYNKAIEINPNNADAWYNKGHVFDRMGKYSEAIYAYGVVIEIDPNNADAWYLRGNAFDSIGKYSEAIYAYDEAIKLIPNNYFAWFRKGSALYGQGNYSDAIKAYDEALGFHNESQPWYSKGEALKALGKTSEADAAFAKAKELDHTG